MIYENTYNINEAFNRNGQSAMFCDHFLHFSHKTTLCFLIKDYHIRTINIMECHALGHFAKSRNLAFWYSFGPPGKFVFLKNWKTWQKSNKFQNVFLFRMIQTSSKFFEQKFKHFLKKSSNKVQTKFERTLKKQFELFYPSFSKMLCFQTMSIYDI
jgi:hypothetical protein